MSKRILVVDDEPAIADAVAACTATPPDLMVLDLMLPGIDGVEVCRQVHQHAPVPVLMLTARTDETDMLIGLGVGADDYMTKPCSMRELTARVKAILRRTSGAGVWGYRDGATRTVDSHMRGSRRKLGPDSVRAVHAVGYALGTP